MLKEMWFGVLLVFAKINHIKLLGQIIPVFQLECNQYAPGTRLHVFTITSKSLGTAAHISYPDHHEINRKRESNGEEVT